MAKPDCLLDDGCALQPPCLPQCKSDTAKNWLQNGGSNGHQAGKTGGLGQMSGQDAKTEQLGAGASMQLHGMQGVPAPIQAWAVKKYHIFP